MTELRFPDPSLADDLVLLRPWAEEDLPSKAAAFGDPLVDRFSNPRTTKVTEEDVRASFSRNEQARLRGEEVNFALAAASRPLHPSGWRCAAALPARASCDPTCCSKGARRDTVVFSLLPADLQLPLPGTPGHRPPGPRQPTPSRSGRIPARPALTPATPKEGKNKSGKPVFLALLRSQCYLDRIPADAEAGNLDAGQGADLPVVPVAGEPDRGAAEKAPRVPRGRGVGDDRVTGPRQRRGVEAGGR